MTSNSYPDDLHRPSLADTGFNVFERFEQYQTALAGRLTRACRALDEREIPYAVDLHLRTYRIIRLPALVKMKLASHRLKDRVHLQDWASVGLLDQIRPADYHPVLAERLRHVLENPDE